MKDKTFCTDSLLDYVRSTIKPKVEKLESGIEVVDHLPYDYVVSFHCPWEISNSNFSWLSGSKYDKATNVGSDTLGRKIMSLVSKIKGVKDVTISHNRLAVSKKKDADWTDLKPKIIAILERERP